MRTDGAGSAQATYDALAPVYDAFTADYDYDTWVSRLLAATPAAGDERRRALDVGCGTGKSFAPLLDRGYEVTGCDISPAMVDVAGGRFGLGSRRLFVADMRALPDCGPFDLITCLDDAVNYLLTGDDLGAAFVSAARLLADGGLYIFDTNTLGTYRTAFAETATLRHSPWTFQWRGDGRPEAAPGERSSAEVVATSAGGERLTARHLQRHHPQGEVRDRLTAAGLELVAVLGQTTGCVLHRQASDLAHTKTVFVARKRSELRQERKEAP